MKTLLLIHFALLFISTNAQERKSVIIDAATHKSIPFVTIKVLHKPLGAIANENGAFSLNIEDSDSVQFSSVGYKIIILKGGLIQDSIQLDPEVNILREITVQTKTFLRTLLLGFDTSKINEQLNWGPGGKTEFAQKIDLPYSNRVYHLKKIFARLKKHGCYGPLLLHVYDTDTVTGQPGEELFSKPIYFSKSNLKKNKATIDLKEEQIYLSNTRSFFIGCSWLPGATAQPCLTTIYFMPSAHATTYTRTIMSNDYHWFQFYWGKNDRQPTTATTIFSVEVEELK